MKNKYKKIILTLVFPYIFVILMMSIPVNVTAVLPHDIRAVHDSIKLDGIEQNNMINTVSVISMRYVTPFSLMLYNMSDRADIRQPSPVESELTFAELNRRRIIQMESSLELSIINAYRLASLSNPNVLIDYEFVGLRIDFRSATLSNLLNIDDLIVCVNGINDSFDNMQNQFRTVRNLELIVRRGQEDVLVNIDNIGVGWWFYPKHTINTQTTYPKFSFPVLGTFIGGPSGGAMQTLSLYADLTGINITKKIVGTGTIEVDGAVGRIGGLRQKVFSAIDNNAVYFFLPRSQLDEVFHLADRINLIPVDTINQAIEVLHGLFG